MALIVQKFGGTSVGTVERIEQVAEKVKKFREAGDDLVIVLSAMSGETNRLIDLAKQITDQPVPREQVYLSFPAQWLMLYADDYLVEVAP